MNKRNKARTAEGKSRLEVLVKKYGGKPGAARACGLSEGTVTAILNGSSGVGVVAEKKIAVALASLQKEAIEKIETRIRLPYAIDPIPVAPSPERQPSPVEVILGWRKDSETLAKIRALLS